jgi:hypothetical protein
MSDIESQNSACEMGQKVTAASGEGATRNTSHEITSEKKVAANRRNALRSTGPRNTERTRFNALKHGLLATGLTYLDDPEEYAAIVNDLASQYSAENPVTEFLISSRAREIIHSRRNTRIDAEIVELVSGECENSDQNLRTIDPTMMKEYGGAQLDRLQRYQTAGLNRLLRCLHELERRRKKQRNREEFEGDENGVLV